MTIYTAIIGHYEELKEPLVITPGWKYICFTDQPLVSKTWEIVQVEPMESSTRTARSLKIVPPIKDFTIWVDASFCINVNLDDFVSRYYKSPMTCINHPVRNCAYKEADVCIKRNLDADKVRGQIEEYSAAGLPQRSGLISSGILMREEAASVVSFCYLWWEQVRKYSTRDQISFAYMHWKYPIANFIEYDYRVRTEFIYTKHFNRR